MPRPLHDMFCLRLRTDAFFPIETLWMFHFYQTGAHIEIVRPADAIAASPLSPELLAQELTYKYIVLDCSYEWLEYSMSPSVPKTYSCEMYVAKCNAEGDATEVCLSFVLSSRRGIAANAGECTIPEMVKGYVFRDSVQLSLEPLTCGKSAKPSRRYDTVETSPVVRFPHADLCSNNPKIGMSTLTHKISRAAGCCTGIALLQGFWSFSCQRCATTKRLWDRGGAISLGDATDCTSFGSPQLENYSPATCTTAIMMHDVYRMRMRMQHFMPIDHWWTFRVYRDREIFIEVEPCVDVTTDATIPDLDQELDSEFVVELADFEPHREDHSPVEAPCSFYVTKFATDDGNWTVNVTGTLSPEHGFRGQWRHCSQYHNYSLWREEFANGSEHTIDGATEITFAVEPAPSPLYPLTCGTYQFNGRVDSDEFAEYDVSLNLKLVPNGRLSGKIFYDDDSESVCGYWSPSDLCFHERNPHGDTMRAYRCSVWFHTIWGPVDRFPVGIERRRDVLASWPGFSSTPSFMEMAVTTMRRRRWSPAHHALYPPSFREAVRLCLLASVSNTTPTYNLPSEVWPRVFEFCEFEWFG